MYAIDFTTATLDDIIARSVTCHPSALSTRLVELVVIHRTSADAMFDRKAGQIARDIATDCRELAQRLIDDGQLGEMTFGQRIQVFAAAAHLQLIPRATQRDIAARDDTARQARAQEQAQAQS